MSQWHEFVDTLATTEHERMTLMERVFDPISVRNLDRLGVGPGWRCLEVGAGGGSVARAMAERVGGRNVVATDLSTILLGPLTELGVTVLRHDVLVDEAPGTFDLIHARYVVDHLPDRETAIRRLVSWLKPNGVLLIEAGTTLPELSSRRATKLAMEAGNAALATNLGTDNSWARTLPGPLWAAGLTGCAAEATAPPVIGGSPMATWLRASYQLLGDKILDTGLLGRDDLDAAYASYSDPSFVDYTWLTVSAWGRKTS
ncbi:methyltransferase domain-containing protein [Actinocrispum wychmicini]|uniref:Methyltransferase family protein n=1 Tax=Actinocrispum wychmicini TaxID=1213861 RepID=A0A4R2J4V4_9PSEU|nr:methyltransferase domain-containing protein [Actinocrispum wychmicini]TCO52867.1 methyltransferase family protein [Actinocrispum wychmicini]